MNHFLKAISVACISVACISTALADSPPAQPMPQPNFKQMDEMIAARNQMLKERLKITSSQEAAWKIYTDATRLKPDAFGPRPDMAALQKLSTPERVEKLRALTKQQVELMTSSNDKRFNAILALYASLTPEQKKIYDSENAF
jgi:periplasmic protein CpxP/Spy